MAVRLLIAFMGAVLGSRYSLSRFAQVALATYAEGWGAPEVFGQLRDEDFLASGGLVPVTLPSGAPDSEELDTLPVEIRRKDINKELFARSGS